MNNYSRNLDKFILSKDYTKSQSIMYRMLHELIRDSNGYIEVNYEECNNKIKEIRGKGFVKRTFIRAMERFEETGAIKVIRRYYGSSDWKIRLPTGFNKNVQSKTEPPKKQQSTSDKPFQVCLQQHLYLKTERAKQKLKEEKEKLEKEFTNKWHIFRRLLIEVGIGFKGPAFERLVKNYSIEELEKSLKLFEVRGGMRGTSNPPGWIVRCLKERWWEDWEHYLGLSEITNGFRYPISVARRYVQKFFDDHVPKEIPYEYLQRLIVEA